MGRVRIGVGGWTYAPWRGVFYPADLPQKRELAYASSHLTSIEINGTFYRSQTPATFAKWREETPEGFVFALKGPRVATNRRILAEAGPTIERFLASGVMELREKLGPINWQLAPTKRFDAEDFAAFLRLLPQRVDGRVIRHAVEVRHASFCAPEFVAMMRETGVAIVLSADGPYPRIPDGTASFVYARIMGTQETEPLGYAPVALDAWADRIAQLARGRDAPDLPPIAAKTPRQAPDDVFLYVISGCKERNPAAAQALIDRLGKPR